MRVFPLISFAPIVRYLKTWKQGWHRVYEVGATSREISLRADGFSNGDRFQLRLINTAGKECDGSNIVESTTCKDALHCIVLRDIVSRRHSAIIGFTIGFIGCMMSMLVLHTRVHAISPHQPIFSHHASLLSRLTP